MYPGLVAFAGVRSPRRVLSNHGDRTFLASRLCFASLGRSAAVLVKRIYPGLVAFAGVRSPRRVSWNRRCWVWLGGVVVESAGACLFSRARAREPPPFAVRCVLFSVDRGVGRFSSRNWNCRSFCGASPATPASDARQRRGDARPRAPPTTPASDAATRPTPQAMPGFVPLGPVNNHGTHFGRIHRETPPPCGVLERFRLPASFAVLQSPRPTSTSEPSELPVSDELSMKVTNVTAIDDGSVATHTP